MPKNMTYISNDSVDTHRDVNPGGFGSSDCKYYVYHFLQLTFSWLELPPGDPDFNGSHSRASHPIIHTVSDMSV